MNDLISTNFVKSFLLSSFFVLFLSISTVQAETVTNVIPSLGLTAQAEYKKGDSRKPVALIVHGFLTTNQFHTLKAMSQALNDVGVATLSPTLTLGIEQRKESVKCQAIHTHTLEEDVAELDAWVQWLKKQGHEKIILVGHSSGSLDVLEYFNRYSDKSVVSGIFTSMFYLSGPELGTSSDEMTFAKNAVASNQKKLRKYHLKFCQGDYLSTPESYLSYVRLTRDYVIESMKNLGIPTTTIMGGKDKRYQSVGQNWLDDLRSTPTQLVIVAGANHFFSSEYEFDLQDRLVESIHKLIDQ